MRKIVYNKKERDGEKEKKEKRNSGIRRKGGERE
jgi:hypothetical protein